MSVSEEQCVDGGQDRTNPFASARGGKSAVVSFAELLWTFLLLLLLQQETKTSLKFCEVAASQAPWSLTSPIGLLHRRTSSLSRRLSLQLIPRRPQLLHPSYSPADVAGRTSSLLPSSFSSSYNESRRHSRRNYGLVVIAGCRFCSRDSLVLIKKLLSIWCHWWYSFSIISKWIFPLKIVESIAVRADSSDKWLLNSVT